jgi:hypothetical protein
MGYFSKALPVDGAETEKIEEVIIPERDPELFKPVAEPEILKTITPEAVFVLGGQYAILMQFAHPGLARGSAEHSNFANRIIERLTTTTRYLNVAIYGTPEEKGAITSVIHHYHSRVSGEGYYADDPGMSWLIQGLLLPITLTSTRTPQVDRGNALHVHPCRERDDLGPSTPILERRTIQRMLDFRYKSADADQHVAQDP